MNILVVAAHPDDEVLGCGGTIARHADAGDRIDIIILGEGMMSRTDKRDNPRYQEKLMHLRENSQKACSVLGASDVVYYDFPDNRMDSVDFLDVVKILEENIRKYKPSTIYTHHAGDLNIDHRLAAKAVVTATRPFEDLFVNEVYAFEVLSSTEWSFGTEDTVFRPNYFINISKYLDLKIEALSFYESETSDFPHPRSKKAVQTLALRRGSQSGLIAAEAFVLLRKIAR